LIELIYGVNILDAFELASKIDGIEGESIGFVLLVTRYLSWPYSSLYSRINCLKRKGI
jgi:hypothetical protein